MKQLTCEMCGSTELVKQDGFFVCQTCGNKYTINETKEAKIDGTVKIDVSDNIANLKKLATKAFKDKKWEELKKHSEKLLELDADNILYDTYFRIAKFSLYVEENYSKVGEYLSGDQKSFIPKLSHFNSLDEVFAIVNTLKNRNNDLTQEENEVVEIFISFSCELLKELLLYVNFHNEIKYESYLLLCAQSLFYISRERKTNEKNRNKLLEKLNICARSNRTIREVEEIFEKSGYYILGYNIESDLQENDEEELLEDGVFYPTPLTKELYWLLKLCYYATVIKQNDELLNEDIFPDEYYELEESEGDKELDIIYSKQENDFREMISLKKDIYCHKGTPEDLDEDLKYNLCRIKENKEALLKQLDCVKMITKYDSKLSNLTKLKEYIDYTNIDEVKKLCNTNKIKNKIEKIENNIIPILEKIINEKQQALEKEKTKTVGGCYVATCVYGSYDCPQVWTLRRFRDDTLGSTWYGRAFIKLYYAISPTLVKWFGHTKWFKKMWKGKLDRMVRKLNKKGVENTPYKDKNWK